MATAVTVTEEEPASTVPRGVGYPEYVRSSSCRSSLAHVGVWSAATRVNLLLAIDINVGPVAWWLYDGNNVAIDLLSSKGHRVVSRPSYSPDMVSISLSRVSTAYRYHKEKLEN